MGTETCKCQAETNYLKYVVKELQIPKWASHLFCFTGNSWEKRNIYGQEATYAILSVSPLFGNQSLDDDGGD